MRGPTPASVRNRKPGARRQSRREPASQEAEMTPRLRLLAASVAVGVTAAGAAHAQKPGGVLQMSHFDSPASMSLHEEATAAVNRPMTGVFNNLILYKQDVAQNSQQSIVPDLATGWSWRSEEH